jgi:cytochrome P450 family 135
MLPPGPRAPRVVQTVQLLRDPIGFLTRCRREYGPIFRVKLIGFPRFVYVAEPELARDVYATDRTIGRASPGRKDFLEPLVGDQSLLVLEGEEWLEHRKLLGPVFHRRHVDDYEEEMERIAGRFLDEIPTDEPVALRPWMQRITLEVILRLVFGVTDEGRLRHLRRLLPELVEAGGSPLVWVVPRALQDRPLLTRFPNPVGRFLKLRAEVDELLYAEIADRRATGSEGRTDVLSHMLGELDDDALRDELITLLVAGHETTATALAWTFERLVRTPDALERLEAEVEAGDDEYLRAVVREALRARPVVLDTPRFLDGPLTLGGYEIPAGWYVSPAMPLVQGDDDFRPERFLDDGAGREGWIPFGGGKRHCVGSHLALLELEVVVRETVRRLQLEAVDPVPERTKLQHVTLVPADLAVVRARTRRRASLPA